MRFAKSVSPTLDYQPLIAADGESLLDIVLKERRRELCLNSLRWLDMKRLAAEGKYTKTLTRTLNDKTYTLEPNSKLYVFPFLQKSWTSTTKSFLTIVSNEYKNKTLSSFGESAHLAMRSTPFTCHVKLDSLFHGKVIVAKIIRRAHRAWHPRGLWQRLYRQV